MGAIADIARMCESFGVRVIKAPGCETRGNGSQWARIEGIINHHTAGGNNIYLDQILVNGRSDLSGPLCNFANLYDGDLAIVAEGPANHAGASGGWDTAPMPVTRDFNRMVVGVECQYRGTEPMSPEQWRTLSVLNYCTMQVCGFGSDMIRIKNHQGTSIQGKVDMGKGLDSRGSVITYPIEDVRAAARAVNDESAQDDGGLNVSAADDIQKQLTGDPVYSGWGLWRFASAPGVDLAKYNGGATLVDIMRGVDREVNSWIDGAGRRDGGRPDKDTLLGHATSAHIASEVLIEKIDKLQASVDQLLNK